MTTTVATTTTADNNGGQVAVIEDLNSKYFKVPVAAFQASGDKSIWILPARPSGGENANDLASLSMSTIVYSHNPEAYILRTLMPEAYGGGAFYNEYTQFQKMWHGIVTGNRAGEVSEEVLSSVQGMATFEGPYVTIFKVGSKFAYVGERALDAPVPTDFRLLDFSNPKPLHGTEAHKIDVMKKSTV